MRYQTAESQVVKEIGDWKKFEKVASDSRRSTLNRNASQRAGWGHGLFSWPGRRL